MSICAYIGRPGSGKSYSVVEYVIFPALKAGISVVTNIPLNIDALQADLPDMPVESLLTQFDNASYDMPGFWSSPIKGAVYVLDEVWRAFPAGQHYDQIPEFKRTFLAEHRHESNELGRSIEIVFVTQDLKQLAASIRPLIDKTYRIEKLNNVGLSSRFRVSIYNGSDEKELINKQFYNYNKKVYKYYKSHTKSDNTGSAIDEKPIDGRASIFSNPIIKYGMILLPLILPFLVYSVYQHLSHPVGNQTESVTPNANHQNTPSQIIPQTPSSPVESKKPVLSYFEKLLSNELRYVAHITIPGRDYSLIQVKSRPGYLSTETLSKEGFTCITSENYIKIIKGANTYYAERYSKHENTSNSIATIVDTEQ